MPLSLTTTLALMFSTVRTMRHTLGRIVALPACLPLAAVAALSLSASPVMASLKSNADGLGGSIVVGIPEDMKPLCGGPLGDSAAPWATRHPKEYQDWQDSVHGRAYLSGNTDAPGCIDCHPDPDDIDIRTPAFRLDIPSRCARCHADERRMQKYEVAPDVYDSYLADFHGSTIAYYHTHDPSVWRYEAVCSDCHRSHAVYPSNDRRSSIAPENLIGTCRRCHPQAQESFAAITTGHFRTDRETAPLAYYIKRIYRFLIPAVIGLMAAYVGLDSIARIRRRIRGTPRSWQSEEEPKEPSSDSR